jgi:hypothetical protein
MIDFNFKYYERYDVSNISNHLKDLDWNEFTFRQESYHVHAETFTIPILWDNEKTQLKYWKDYNIFKNDLDSIGDILTTKIGEGHIETAILINLPKSKKIKPHTDAHIYFDSRNRIHIPIVTNDMCIFEVDGEEINMKQGEIWEINNSDKPHSVINNGETDRIHLLIDWKVIDKNNSKKSKTLL